MYFRLEIACLGNHFHNAFLGFHRVPRQIPDLLFIPAMFCHWLDQEFPYSHRLSSFWSYCWEICWLITATNFSVSRYPTFLIEGMSAWRMTDAFKRVLRSPHQFSLRRSIGVAGLSTMEIISVRRLSAVPLFRWIIFGSFKFPTDPRFSSRRVKATLVLGSDSILCIASQYPLLCWEHRVACLYKLEHVSDSFLSLPRRHPSVMWRKEDKNLWFSLADIHRFKHLKPYSERLSPMPSLNMKITYLASINIADCKRWEPLISLSVGRSMLLCRIHSPLTPVKLLRCPQLDDVPTEDVQNVIRCNE